MASTNSEPRDDLPASRDSKFAMLKNLLLADEQRLLSDLQHRLSSLEEDHAQLDALRDRIAELEEQIVSRAELDRRLEENRFDAERLSHLLPGAIDRSSAQDTALAESLSPTLAAAFHESVQRNPKSLADAIAPIMGPAIRRSISQAIAGMLQSLNQTLDNSFSIRGMRWRWEAMTTGKSFAEVVLLHSLIYQVEHVFLIHAADGILLGHVSSQPGSEGDADIVSGMLTALQDFVRDSFGGEPADALQDLRVGDRNVFVEHGGDVILAAVIRGVPPEDLRTTMQETVELFQQKYGQLLLEFRGDAAPFQPFEARLRECLQSAYREEQKTRSNAQKWMGRIRLVGSAAVLLAVMTWWGLRVRDASRIAEYRQLLAVPESVTMQLRRGVLELSGTAHDDWIQRVLAAAPTLRLVDRVDTTLLVNLDEKWLQCLSALREQPGLAITTAERQGAVYRLEGLRDPLAADPQQTLRDYGLAEGQVLAKFTPYHSVVPEFVMARTRQLLGDEPTLQWEFQQGVLKVSGAASDAWCQNADHLAGQLDGITLDTSHVVNLDRQQLQELAGRIRTAQLEHLDGSAELVADQSKRLDEVAEDLRNLFELAERIQQPLRVIVLGFADAEESQTSPPQTLSESRARLVWKELTARAISPERLLIRALGASRPLGLNPQDLPPDMRRTLFDVKLGGDL